MAVPTAAGVLPVVLVMLGFSVLPFSALTLIAVTGQLIGQLIGGAMTAATLAGRRILGELHTRHGEVEAALALGFTDADARRLVAGPVAGEALLPALDQTRTVGMGPCRAPCGTDPRRCQPGGCRIEEGRLSPTGGSATVAGDDGSYEAGQGQRAPCGGPERRFERRSFGM